MYYFSVEHIENPMYEQQQAERLGGHWAMETLIMFILLFYLLQIVVIQGRSFVGGFPVDFCCNVVWQVRT